MSTLKRCKVVMLSTKEESNISLLNKDELMFSRYMFPNGENYNNQHLYIISDEKIQKGDWCLVDVSNSTDEIIWSVKQLKRFDAGVRNYSDEWIFEDGYRTSLGGTINKIISTTDESLK